MSLVRVPQPYDFDLSLTRFREWGTDGSIVWHAGGLHRVVAGTEVRIEPARGGVRVEPGSPEAELYDVFLKPRDWAGND